MCGITGFVGKGNKQILERMTTVLSHRGPDDSGTYFDANKKVALGHARLSILDVSPAGHQPMWSDDGTIGIVFNGEIYNFQQLKKELSTEYAFKSATDTEVIIYAYKHFGERCFERFEGMFALAIYDLSRQRLVLARDRAGKKPLYWSYSNNTFIFGSELKSLILHPDFKKEPDLLSINKYLQFDFIPTPHTVWKNCQKLEAGSYLIFERGKYSINKYWHPRFEESDITFDEAQKKLDSLIAEAVKNRLVADVPVGIFLSGGLDSSILAYYAKLQSNGPVKSFSIGFEEKSFDESSYARQVASHIGTEHCEKIVIGQEITKVIPFVLNNLDEPMADASIIPTYVLSKFAREHVTVALSGDGGDELFAGYPTFIAEKFAAHYLKLPESIRKNVTEKLIRKLPSSSRNFSLDFKMKKFIEGFDVDDEYRHQVWLGSFSPAMRRNLFKKEIWDQVTRNEFKDIDLIHEDYLVHGGVNSLNKILYEYERTYLMDEVLVKVDRATMLTSLEARSPLLDYKIMDFAHHLPANFKQNGLKSKYILKKMMEGKLPKKIIHRKKKGFGMPVAEWLRGALKPLLDKQLSRQAVEKMGLFNYEVIARLKADHDSGRQDNRKQLWNLLVLSNWWNNFNS